MAKNLYAQQKVLVTGGTRGIGLAIAERFSEQGAEVVITVRPGGRGNAVADELSGSSRNISFVPVEMANVASIRQMMGVSVSRLGGLDVLVNNAGISAKGTLKWLSESEWDAVQAVNLKGPTFCMQAALAHMQERGGSIINVASIAGLDTPYGKGAYAASKAGLIAVSQVAAKEFAADGIRVNVIAPGLIDTDLSNRVSPEHQAAFVAETPLGRIGDPAEIADACVFLASEGAQFITGQVLRIDGGLRL